MEKRCGLDSLWANHEGRMKKLVREAADTPPPPTDLRQRHLCHVKTSGMKSIAYTLEDAERRFTEDFPNWEQELIKCPPGELYYDQMKPFTRARDLEEKYGNRPAKEWGRTKENVKDRGLYVNRTGDMGEALVKLGVENEMRGKPGLLLSGFRLMDYLAKEGKNEEGGKLALHTSLNYEK